MANITFTSEHHNKLKQLATEMLFSDRKIPGQVGTSLSIHDLLHNTSITTLQILLRNTRKNIDVKENLDEWSMTAYQQAELARLNKDKDLLNLIIGYKKHLDEKETNSKKLADIRNKIAQIKESEMSPTDRLAALAEQEKQLSIATGEEQDTTITTSSS